MVNGYRSRQFTDVRCHPDRLEQPLHWKKPRRIFVNSMSDLFHEAVPFEFIDNIFAAMALCPQHDFQVLTKRPEGMRKYFEDIGLRQELIGIEAEYISGTDRFSEMLPRWTLPLPNVWLGISAENTATLDYRWPLLARTPAAVRFLSLEPLLEDVSRSLELHLTELSADDEGPAVPIPDWVIAGSESGPHARDYETEWFANVARQCEQAGVAFFMKQLTVRGRKIPFEEFPGYLQVRQYPAAV